MELGLQFVSIDANEVRKKEKKQKKRDKREKKRLKKVAFRPVREICT